MAIVSDTNFSRSTLLSSERSAQFLTVTIGLCLLSIWTLFGWIAYEGYASEWSCALVYESNVETLIAHDISRTIELFDLSIVAAGKNAMDPSINALPNAVRKKALFDASAAAPGLGSILILDKSGKVTEASRNEATLGIDMSDRDYFAAQRDWSANAQPFISHIFRSRMSGRMMIGLSRPVLAADGSFGGVAVGSITADFFASLLSGVKLPPNSSMMLVHDDGTVMLRVPIVANVVSPPVSTDFAAFARSGTSYVAKSAFDGVDRLYSVREIGRLPAYLVIGFSTDEILRRWWWRMTVIGLGFVALSAIVVFLAVLLQRELRRRAADEKALLELATTDGLTLLANRRRFDETLDLEWRRAAREASSIALLMIDCDFFKAFNDTYGHLEGDRALKIIAETLRRCVKRPGDIVARFGGEEFIVLLPRTDCAGANRIAEAMREAVVEAALPHTTSASGRLTISIGAAARRPVMPESASDLIEAADTALYRAKAEGRDRIMLECPDASPQDDWFQLCQPHGT